VLLRFSIKESAYKALHKYVNRYVQFAEAEVYPCGNRDGGTAEIKLLLNSNDKVATSSDLSNKSVYKIEAHWRRLCIQLQPQPTAAANASDVQTDADVDKAALHSSTDTLAEPTEEFHVFLTCANVQKL
jgi:4'-phosphopantetheinyl transferase superfamily